MQNAVKTFHRFNQQDGKIRIILIELGIERWKKRRHVRRPSLSYVNQIGGHNARAAY